MTDSPDGRDEVDQRLTADGQRWRDGRQFDADLNALLPPDSAATGRRRGPAVWLIAAAGVAAVAVTITLVASVGGRSSTAGPPAGPVVSSGASFSMPSTSVGRSTQTMTPPASGGSALVCPPSLTVSFDTRGPMPVPASPTIDTGGRLGPLEVPIKALVCRYGPVPYSTGAKLPDIEQPRLTVARQLTGLQTLAGDLAWASIHTSRDCTDMAGPMAGQLLAVEYSGGRTLWVRADEDVNRCSEPSNGVFHGGQYLGAQLASAAATGVWTRSKPQDAEIGCSEPGRFGMEKQFIPSDPVSVQICRTNGKPTTPVLTAGFTDLVTKINSRPTTSSANGATCNHNDPSTAARTIVFNYASGPGVTVIYDPSCTPALTNGALAIGTDPGIANQIQKLGG